MNHAINDIERQCEAFLRLFDDALLNEHGADPAEWLREEWIRNPEHTAQLLKVSTKYWKDAPEVLDGILAVSRLLADPRFSETVYQISQSRKVHPNDQVRALSYLAAHGFETALHGYRHTVMKCLRGFLKGTVKFDEVTSVLTKSCVLQLQPEPEAFEIAEYLVDQRDIYFPWEQRKWTEAIAISWRGDWARIEQIARDKREDMTLRAAAVYVTGCRRNPDRHSFFDEIYHTAKPVEVRNECVGAIVYSSRLDDADAFLQAELEKARRVKTSYPDIFRLHLGSYYMPRLSVLLEGELVHWLSIVDANSFPRTSLANRSDYLAWAYLALERHGTSFSDIYRQHRQVIERHRRFRKNLFTLNDLIALRPAL